MRRALVAAILSCAGALASASQGTVRYHNGKIVSDETPTRIEIGSEFDNTRKGKVEVPAFPGDVIYLSVTVHSAAGTPRRDVPVEIVSKNGIAAMEKSDRTDRDGNLDFEMIAGAPGLDTVTVRAAGASEIFYVNVIAPQRHEWLGALNLDGTTSWDLLMSANVHMARDAVSATFPAPLQALDSKTVRLAGFMLPLEPEGRQKHFLFSANPPSCFFHPPGGPASAVEVFADPGIKTSMDPLVIEGRLQLSARSPGGILYTLRDARLVASHS